jgi:uncharacterized membrane protein (UPF0127 family)
MRSAVVEINSNQWQVDVAETWSELAAGLGGLAGIPVGTGMLFDLVADQYITITTEPMLFNIDVAIISSALVVENVALNVPPGQVLTSDVPARYFLEVNAGELSAVGVGDPVLITAVQPAQYAPAFWQGLLVGVARFGLIALGGSAMLKGVGVKGAVKGAATAGARALEARGVEEAARKAREKLGLVPTTHYSPGLLLAPMMPPEIYDDYLFRRHVLDLVKAGKDISDADLRRLWEEWKRMTPAQQALASSRLRGEREYEGPPEELEFFADTREHIQKSLDGNGVRHRVDTAFQEAITRSRRRRGEPGNRRTAEGHR